MTPRLFLVAWVPLIATMVSWGLAFSFSRLSLQAIGPGPAAMLRYGLAALVLLGALAVVDRGIPRIPRGMGVRLAVAGIIGVGVYNGLFFLGLSMAPAVDGASIMPVTSPIATAAIALVIARERPGRMRLAALALGVVGAAIYFVSVPVTAAYPDRLLGDLLLFAAAAIWGAYTLMGRPLMAVAGPMRVTTWAMAAGACVFVVAALPSAIEVDWAAQPADVWLWIGYLGIVPTALGYSLYYRGVRDVGPTSAVVVMFLVPIAGIGGAILILGDTIGGLQLLGSATMAVGAVLAVLSTLPARADPHRRAV
ncbi:MAG: DMT family transporter [Chloroflexota bacterium]